MRHRQRAPAKINLGLHVLRRRADGYHEVETVLHRIDWADTITAEPADTLSFTCSDPALPTNEENLCVRAARRLAAAFGVTQGAALHLEKRVPYGAGLGGGSSDAAATLEVLSRLWEVNASRVELHQIGQRLGSDVPFFLRNSPAAYATGRGEVLSEVASDEAYQLPYPVLIAVPPAEIGTPWAYDHVTPRETDRVDLRPVVRSNDLSRWRTVLTNDFETPILQAKPSVASVYEAVQRAGAGYTSLSGSGSAVYGVFHDLEGAETARDDVRTDDIRTHLHTPT